MNAVFVININRDNIWNLCKKSVEDYCKKFGFDLIVITEPKYNLNQIMNHSGYNYLTFEKNQVYEYFDKYDRILRLDCDVLINKTCPNIFDKVPEIAVGGVYEDVGSRRLDRRMQMKKIYASFSNGYFNSGVLVIPKLYREILWDFPNDKYAIEFLDLGDFKEQTLFNYHVTRYGLFKYNLDFRYNHMSMFSEEWNGSPIIQDSYIIHFAGVQAGKEEKIKRAKIVLGLE